MNSLQYRHVDVFSDKPFSGNGLTVFILDNELSSAAMQKITQEMRQFESIFLLPLNKPNAFRARVFTMEEELDFAGHPVLGAASVLHEKFSQTESAEWQIELNAKTVQVQTEKNKTGFSATMNQGKPEFLGTLTKDDEILFWGGLDLSPDDLDEQLPLEIVSTGLPYLIVPVKQNLAKAKIVIRDFEELLMRFGAKFVYVFDRTRMEGRTWDNLGLIEDAATGSAAGPTAALLVKHGFVAPENEIILNQGSFLNRPSKLFVKAQGTRENIASVEVGGNVCLVASGNFDENVLQRGKSR